mgnify:CR=1 FL=1
MKKKMILMLTACFMLLGQAVADNVLTVSDVNVPQGGQATIEIGCDFDTEFTAFELQLSLPEGLSLLCDEDGKPVIERAFDGSHVISGNLLPSNGNYKFTCYSTNENSLLLPTTGALLRLTVVADGSLPMGSNLNASITATEFTRLADSKGENLDDVEFTIHITEYRTVLDENALTIPESEENANVRVRRTIKANEWSTICLPFAMTEAQVKTAFGEDVQIADFVDTQSTYDDADNVVGISIAFEDVTAIAANHPYIIKVSSPITEFTVDNVDIDPAEEDALIEVDNGLTGRRRVVYGGFYGTYHAQTTLEEFSLFLSDNQFWYSTGKTKMKAFRAYFVMADVLTDVEGAGARISLQFEEETTTGIREKGRTMRDGKTYNLQGQHVEKPRKGLYIRDNRKIFVK